MTEETIEIKENIRYTDRTSNIALYENKYLFHNNECFIQFYMTVKLAQCRI